MNIAVLKEKLETLDSLFCRKDDMSEARQGKALVLDLSDESFFSWDIPSQFLQAYVSGPALGARLWAEFAGSDVEDPSSYEANNPVVITASSLSNSGMPGCESVSIAFRSPVSGNLCFNVVSNTVGMRLASLGYCALIILGRLRRPTVVDIRKSGVSFNVSEVFIGYTVSQMEQLIGLTPIMTAMTIGPAGEQKVPYATVVCEGAATGRGGLGCVFGFKNIKSLCITGFCTDFVRSGHPEEAEKAIAELRSVLSESTSCKTIQECGSAIVVKTASRHGWAPVSNFSRRTDPRLFHLGGDEVSRRYGQEHGGCIGCPVMCRHRTKSGVPIPGYEAILMLGSNVMCFDMDVIIDRYSQCLEFGLDPISVGNVMGWAKEAHDSGKAEFLGPDFSFTDNSKVLPLIEMIARRVGAGETMSYGTYALGKALGDESFAYTMHGIECGPFDYRGAFSQCISDAMGFWFSNCFEITSGIVSKVHADWAVLNERLVMGFQSLGISPSLVVPTMVEGKKLLRKASTIIPNSVIKRMKPSLIADTVSAVTGSVTTADDILELGDRCWRVIYEIDRILGFDMLSDSDRVLPEHFAMDPFSNCKVDSIVPFRALVDRYCFLRKQTIAIQSSGLNLD